MRHLKVARTLRGLDVEALDGILAGSTRPTLASEHVYCTWTSALQSFIVLCRGSYRTWDTELAHFLDSLPAHGYKFCEKNCLFTSQRSAFCAHFPVYSSMTMKIINSICLPLEIKCKPNVSDLKSEKIEEVGVLLFWFNVILFFLSVSSCVFLFCHTFLSYYKLSSSLLWIFFCYVSLKLVIVFDTTIYPT